MDCICEKIDELNKKTIKNQLYKGRMSVIINLTMNKSVWGDGRNGRTIDVSERNDGLMWALVKEKPEVGLWMKRVPIPEVGPTDVKIKIHKTAICGTDVHIWQWNEWAQNTIPVGMTVGHE